MKTFWQQFWSNVSSAIRFMLSNLTCFIVENLFTHTHVFLNIDCIFSAKSFSLKNLCSLTNFQKLSAVSNTISIVHFYWKMLCLFQLKLPTAGMGNQFGWRATLRRPRLADRETYLFGGIEFIVPDVLFKTTNAGAPKKHRGYPDMCPSGGLAAALPSNLIVKLINEAKFYTETVLFLCKCALSSASNSVRQM